MADVDLHEINEAFAVVALANAKLLKFLSRRSTSAAVCSCFCPLSTVKRERVQWTTHATPLTFALITSKRRRLTFCVMAFKGSRLATRSAALGRESSRHSKTLGHNGKQASNLPTKTLLQPEEYAGLSTCRLV